LRPRPLGKCSAGNVLSVIHIEREGKRKKERIMHKSLIKYVGVSRIERHPSKAIGGP
jgi:hypothetical protein